MMVLQTLALTVLSLASQPDDPIATALHEAGSEARIANEHVVTLASSFFEGREPGTPGGRRAEDYVEHHFRSLGLPGLFEGGYRQAFELPGRVQVDRASMTLHLPDGDVTLTPGEDFNVLAISGPGSVTAPLAFVGFGIVIASDGYTSYPRPFDIEGKIAIALTHEPMDELGMSRYRDVGWSINASIPPKAGAAIKRGAAGVILVDPPGVRDPSHGSLLTAEDTSGFGQLMAPVGAVTPEIGDRLIRAADVEGRSLADLAGMVNARGSVVDLPEASVTIDAEVSVPETANIGAILPGKGALADEWIVVSAHHDGLGMGSVRTEVQDEWHPSTSGATSVAGLLLIASRMTEAYESLDDARSVAFVAFTGQKAGRLGSREFIDVPPIPPTAIDLVIDVGAIGSLDDDGIRVHGVGTALGLESRIEYHFDSMDAFITTERDSTRISDDETFRRQRIPALHIETSASDMVGTPWDTSDRVNRSGLVQVVDLIDRIARAQAVDPEDLDFSDPSTRPDQVEIARGPRVRVGIQAAEDPEGIRVVQVFPGTSAADAGLQVGDVLTVWDGHPLNLRMYMSLVGGHDPGDEVQVTLRRGDEELPITLELRSD